MSPLYLHRIKEMDMQNIQKKAPLANNHISVDCVVIGFDGKITTLVFLSSAQYARNVSLPIWSLAIKSVDICSSGVSMFLFAKR